MKNLDWKSSVLAAFAGGILLVMIVWLYDQTLGDPNDPLESHVHLALIAFMGAIVGFSVQAAERISGES